MQLLHERDVFWQFRQGDKQERQMFKELNVFYGQLSTHKPILLVRF